MPIQQIARWIEEHVRDAKHIERALAEYKNRFTIKRETKKEESGYDPTKTRDADL